MKIALMGAAPSSRLDGPFGDISWEIWACSPGNYDFPRVDAWFELHSLKRKWVPGNEPYIECLTKHSRVYLAVPDARLPNGLIYPKDAILAKYPKMHHTFFSSSVAWMLALALEYKPEAIGMWGIDMAANDEYAYQRPGCQFFMGEAEKQGIKIVTPPEADIAEVHPLYGYKEQWPMYWKQRVRRKELKARLKDCDNRLATANAEKMMLQGCLQDIDYVDNTWLKP